MRKAQVFALVLVALMGSVASAAIPAGGSVGDGNISLVYDPADGSLKLDAAGKKVTTLEVHSTAGYFTGTAPSQVSPPFDVFNATKFFLLKTAGIGDENFGPALAKGLSVDALSSDLKVAGSILPSGSLGTVDLVYIPEPSSLVLASLGLLGLVRRRK